MCIERNCDICPDFECVHCKNEEVWDIPFTDYSECIFGGPCGRESCFQCSVYAENYIDDEYFD